MSHCFAVAMKSLANVGIIFFLKDFAFYVKISLIVKDHGGQVPCNKIGVVSFYGVLTRVCACKRESKLQIESTRRMRSETMKNKLLENRYSTTFGVDPVPRKRPILKAFKTI